MRLRNVNVNPLRGLAATICALTAAATIGATATPAHAVTYLPVDTAGCCIYQTTAPAPRAPTPNASIEQQMVDRFMADVNLERASRNLPTITYSPNLAALATSWTDQLRTIHPTGGNCQLDRNVGPSCHSTGIHPDGTTWNWAYPTYLADLTAWAGEVTFTSSVGGTPSHLVEAYMQSGPHASTILDPTWDFAAPAVTCLPNGTAYTIIAFGARQPGRRSYPTGWNNPRLPTARPASYSGPAEQPGEPTCPTSTPGTPGGGTGDPGATSPTRLFNALTPTRIVDTRDATQGLPAGGSLALHVTGNFGVPALNQVAAVALNITAVNPNAPGFMAAYPCSAGWSGTSNLNYTAGGIVPNAAIVAPDTTGDICIRTSAAAHLVVDVTGWYATSPNQLTMLPAPTRLLDTRNRSIEPVAASGVTQIATGATPGSTVILNITGTDGPAAGYVTAWPCDQTRPAVSNLNRSGPTPIANLALIPVDTLGRVCLFTQTASHLVVDQFGTLAPATTLTGFVPANPISRAYDSRTAGGRLAAGETRTIPVNAPADAAGVALNVTVDAPAAAGYLTVWPCGLDRPTSSNVNYVAGETRANGVNVGVGTGNAVCVYAQQSLDVIVDLDGTYR